MIAIAVFDFVDEVADELNGPDRDDNAELKSDDLSVTFLESFFEQFFGALGKRISGTSRRAKRQAVEIAERLRESEDSTDRSIRRLVVSFEELCDLMADAQGNYGGSAVTRDQIYPILTRTLDRAGEWLQSVNEEALAQRCSQAEEVFRAAL